MYPLKPINTTPSSLENGPNKLEKERRKLERERGGRRGGKIHLSLSLIFLEILMLPLFSANIHDHSFFLEPTYMSFHILSTNTPFLVSLTRRKLGLLDAHLYHPISPLSLFTFLSPSPVTTDPTLVFFFFLFLIHF